MDTFDFGNPDFSTASSPLAFCRNRFGKQSSPSPGPNAHTRSSSTSPSDINYNNGSNFAVDQSNQAATSMQPSLSGQSHNQNGNNNAAQQQGQMPQLSISDLQQMLLQREKTERIQNMQTALLKQQLDQLSRMQQHHQQQQQYAQQHQQQPNLQLNLSAQAGQLSPGQQQQQQQHQAGQSAWPQQQQHMNNAQGQPGDQSNVLAQYGLITPMGSGPFNSSACPPGSANFMSPLTIQPNSQPGSVGVQHRPGHDYLGSYTPLESPAVTPASVFSTGSTGIVMSELFSPLTSPALGPQPPSLNEIMLPPATLQHHAQTSQQSVMHGSPAISAVNNNFTPTASPLALIAKGSSKIRKNRSTTAEARANKVRPSPLIKPVAGPIKKKKETLASPSTATPTANGNGGFSNGASGASGSGSSSRRASITTAPAEAHSRNQSADVAQSEATCSTPSPIDLSGGGAMPPPSGPTNKILTPSSIMGIRSSPSGSSPRNASSQKGKEPEPFPQQQQMMMGGATPLAPQPMSQPPPPPMGYPTIAPFPGAAAVGGPKVTFNLPPQQHIQPSGLSQADHDAWLTYKSAGGLESRRTSHKAAEQKRRDSLKFCFDELRGLLPAITLDEDAPNGSLLGPDGREEDVEAEQFDPTEVGDPEQARAANKAISKVALLRHSNEYLVRLKKRLERRDKALEVCRKEVRELREKLGLGESEDPSVTGKGAPFGWIDGGVAGYDFGAEGEKSGNASPEEGTGKVEMDQTA